eukprot:m.122579 g.122579  ORF g.122579 m.122579 type:complete len:87 (+) comp52127_c0_seq8:62-322(+)
MAPIVSSSITSMRSSVALIFIIGLRLPGLLIVEEGNFSKDGLMTRALDAHHHWSHHLRRYRSLQDVMEQGSALEQGSVLERGSVLE